MRLPLRCIATEEAASPDFLLTMVLSPLNENPNAPFSYLDLRDLQQRNRMLVGLLGCHDD